MNYNGTFQTATSCGVGNNSVEDILYSQNSKFRAAFDVNGDGLGDNRDLFALGDELVVAGLARPSSMLTSSLLLTRGDLNNSGTTNLADFETLYANFGPATWLFDLNVDGVGGCRRCRDVRDAARAQRSRAISTSTARSTPRTTRSGGIALGQVGSALVADGDFDGDVDNDDYIVWKAAFGFQRGTVPGRFRRPRRVCRSRGRRPCCWPWWR